MSYYIQYQDPADQQWKTLGNEKLWPIAFREQDEADQYAQTNFEYPYTYIIYDNTGRVVKTVKIYGI